jgi:hypothetical protein
MDLKTIYSGAEKLINQLIRKESTAQGHYLTGALEDSLTSKVVKNDLQGFAIYYTKFVDEGVPAESASMKQFPFMVRYFQKRGLEEKEAKAAAAATIHKWMKEGMSTQASKRFSKTGARQNMIEAAFTSPSIDQYMSETFDFAVEEKYLKEKSETI